MKMEHVSTERLFEASEDGDLSADELTHLRECSDCREVLSVLTRYNRLRLQKLASGSVSQHIPLPDLWLHGNASEIDGIYLMHLQGCELCIGTLALCRNA